MMLADLMGFIRLWVALSLSFVALSAGLPVFGLAAAEPESAAMGVGGVECAPLSAVVDAKAIAVDASFEFTDHELRYGGYGLRPISHLIRGPEFYFPDHELAYAGRYGLVEVPVVVSGDAFYFLDHELDYGGGYGLAEIPGVVSGPEFYFVDHELSYDGGYDLAEIPGVDGGETFDFPDHELAYAGGYGLCAAALAVR